ncbi:transmembrane protein 179-like [Plakobranchus ocellatus]|uniref:Transmembrane protein 179-like n=1 Tax=Plakobranchus ocellatus TaxID=259542 RepID=A0AAV4AYP8_9GAST|nr:transmembrane protein 179-like [Plakobranchus ocellatus]
MFQMRTVFIQAKLEKNVIGDFVVEQPNRNKLCEEGQDYEIGQDIDVNANNYFVQWQVTQFGIWFLWLTWLTLSVMALVRLYRYHRIESFTASMNNERERLISQVTQNPETA